jgi:hypothetical protein
MKIQISVHHQAVFLIQRTECVGVPTALNVLVWLTL